MGNFFSGPTKLTFLQVLILGLVPLGQLWARIFYFNGSLDKWWLMFPIFLIPPFSFIPLLLMKFGFVADGKGSNPLDYWMILPIIAKFIIPFIMPYIIDEDSEMLTSIVSLVLQLLTIMSVNLIRRYNNCVPPYAPNKITGDSIGKAAIDSTIAFGIGEISAFVIPWLPFVGIVITVLELIPVLGEFVDTILWTLGFVASYVLINMFNQDDMNKFCSTPFTGNLQDRIPFFISVIAIIATRVFNMFSPI
jgi:hypothetical protein